MHLLITIGKCWFLNFLLYASQCIRDIFKIFTHNGGFEDGLLDEANLIPTRPSVVAMTTKFETKLAITRLAQEISRKPLCAVVATVLSNSSV